jgi:hypothetical protein
MCFPTERTGMENFFFRLAQQRMFRIYEFAIMTKTEPVGKTLIVENEMIE